MMSGAQSMQVVVKQTFLELQEGDSKFAMRPRAFSDVTCHTATFGFDDDETASTTSSARFEGSVSDDLAIEVTDWASASDWDAQEQACEVPAGPWGEQSTQATTTVQFRNLPKQLSRDAFIETLNVEGFAGLYDFVNLPIGLKTGLGFSYAFVNWTSEKHAQSAFAHFTGFCAWPHQSKPCCARWATERDQGLRAQLERTWASGILRDDVADDLKPIFLRDGVRAPFPSDA